MKEYIKDNTFLILMLLGAAIFLQNAWVPGFFQDGYLYAAFGKNAATKGLWMVPRLSQSTYYEFYDHTNFTFLMEGLFFKVFGSSFVSARFFASLFTLSTGVLLFRFIKKESGQKIAALSLLLFFLIPPLMKKGRFPNIDLPLMFFFFISLSYYWRAFKQSNWRNWIFCGLGFGLCMLTKGPMAIWVPMVIVLHLMQSRNLNLLKDIKPWLSFILGLSLFSLWPFSLYLTNNFEIFEKWYHFTIVASVMEGRGASTPWYTYILFLIKNTSLVFFLALFTIYKNIATLKNSFLYLVTIVFFTIIFSLSIRGLKYSNYLIPLYPFLAILGGHGITLVWRNGADKILNFFKYLIPVFMLVLLVFPITNKIRRDPEIFKTREILSLANALPRQWYTFRSSYPFWSLAAMNGYLDYSNTINIDKVEDIPIEGNTLVLVKESDLSIFLSRFEVSDYYKQTFYFKEKKLFVYLPKTVNLENLSF